MTTDAAGGQLGTSVGKALGLLAAFGGEGTTVPLSALAQRAGLPKSTAHRLLAVLESNGYVQRRGTGYCVGRRLFEIGNLIPDARPHSLRTAAMPYLSELYEVTHQTVHLAVLDGHEVIYLDKVHGHRSLDTPTWIGARLPASCTALGKAVLAFSDETTVRSALAKGLPRRTPYSISGHQLFADVLARARDEGVTTDNEESRIGLSCVAAPIIDPVTGYAGAAISLSGASVNLRRVRAPLRRAVEALAAALPKSAFPTL
jgi:DNA-binding IclR family transcriptional regulator